MKHDHTETLYSECEFVHIPLTKNERMLISERINRKEQKNKIKIEIRLLFTLLKFVVSVSLDLSSTRGFNECGIYLYSSRL